MHRLFAAPAAALRVALSLLAAVLLAATLANVTAGPAHAAAAVPPTPKGLTASIESAQPYVGQTRCDPIAKPGVSAFRDLLLRTYPDSGSLGIVRDCGSGGQSEHKEGRAFDWGVSVDNANQVAEVNALTSWLLATDSYGNTFAMAKRLGIMYMIWNKRMWRAYGQGGWSAYTGSSPHTDHVHFSFGWNGANKATSYWSGAVAPIDYGPSAATPITPVRAVGNLKLLRLYGEMPLSQGSSGAAVSTVQRALNIDADGAYGSQTARAVNDFQRQQGLTVSGSWRSPEWRTMFPPPINPFGQFSDPRATPGGTLLTGWAIDADTTGPISVALTVDGARVPSTTASVSRADVNASYPGSGPAHGFSAVVKIADGTHTVCATGVNQPGSPGVDTPLGCRSVVVKSGAWGALESATQVLRDVRVAGWALDSGTADPVQVQVTVDDVRVATLTANTSRPDIGAQWPGFGDKHGYVADLSLSQGTHRVCTTASRASGSGSVALGCSAVTVRHNPLGPYEALYQVPGGTYARGWALDPDTTAPINVILSVDGKRVRMVKATAARPDLAQAYPAHGTDHGWSTVWNVPEGTHRVCAFLANAAGTPGPETAAGCRTVTVRRSPVGQFAALHTVPGGSVTVTGWAIDPDTASPSQVEVWVDGALTSTLTAAGVRPDIGASHAGYGDDHGFTGSLTPSPGRHTVCVYGVNAEGTPGARSAFGCLGVVVSTTVGAFEAIKGGTGVLEARGWALDPDVVAPIQVWGYVDGKPIRSGAANRTWGDLAVRWPSYGADHGWVLTIAATKGSHQVCVTAINASGTPGDRASLGCRQVTVR